MEKKFIACLVLAAGFALSFLFLVKTALAKTDLSLLETDITFSKESPFDGDSVRIYARVFNIGDEDATGNVVFLINGEKQGGPSQYLLELTLMMMFLLIGRQKPARIILE